MKLRIQIVFAVAVSVATADVGATAQISDQIIIDGRSEQLFSEPLLDAFSVHPQLHKKLIQHASPGRCSASWRGYAATWEVRENVLYLVSVRADPCSSDKSIPLAELFPGAAGPVKAAWVNGTIKIPQGDQIEYVHMGYESQYERYLFLTVHKGKIIKRALTSGRKPGAPIKPPNSSVK